MMGNHSTDFPPAGEPKEDPKKTTGKTMDELEREKEKELADKDKRGDPPIRKTGDDALY
jgi:hypothetical protein